MAVYQYDPNQVSVILGGQAISGYADGTFIKVERNEQAWNLKVGVDGEGARAKNNNTSGKITITLMQSSASNDVLSGFALADESSGAGTFPALVLDHNGTSKITALTMWVQKFANLEDAKEITMREWVLETDALVMLVGGNNQQT
jgi:hypothetical protein